MKLATKLQFESTIGADLIKAVKATIDDLNAAHPWYVCSFVEKEDPNDPELRIIGQISAIDDDHIRVTNAHMGIDPRGYYTEITITQRLWKEAPQVPISDPTDEQRLFAEALEKKLPT